jgi:CheY-like chemotaxis protein
MGEEISHVLLVEDNPDHAELVMRMLADSPPQAKVVHHVSDGEAALDYLFRRGDFANPDQSPRPRLILLDLRLPKVDGLAALTEIRASPDEKLQRIPVVVITSSEADKDVAAAYDLRANSCLSKVVDYKTFHKLIADTVYYWLVCNRPADSYAAGY